MEYVLYHDTARTIFRSISLSKNRQIGNLIFCIALLYHKDPRDSLVIILRLRAFIKVDHRSVNASIKCFCKKMPERTINLWKVVMKA